MGTARGWIAFLLLAACALTLRPADARGQIRPLDVRGVRPLDFGDVLAGISMSVMAVDASRSGVYVIRGARYAEILTVFTLPDNLRGLGGASLPIVFDADDAAYFAGHNPQPIVFDPHAPFIYVLDHNGRVQVQLGGTVNAGYSQPAGPYEAPVTLTVAYTGN